MNAMKMVDIRQKRLLSCVLWIFDSMSGNKLVINLGSAEFPRDTKTQRYSHFRSGGDGAFLRHRRHHCHCHRFDSFGFVSYRLSFDFTAIYEPLSWLCYVKLLPLS